MSSWFFIRWLLNPTYTRTWIVLQCEGNLIWREFLGVINIYTSQEMIMRGGVRCMFFIWRKGSLWPIFSFIFIIPCDPFLVLFSLSGESNPRITHSQCMNFQHFLPISDYNSDCFTKTHSNTQRLWVIFDK